MPADPMAMIERLRLEYAVQVPIEDAPALPAPPITRKEKISANEARIAELQQMLFAEAKEVQPMV